MLSHVSSPSASLPAPPIPARADRWALFLDVDGCLLDFADDPAAVVVTPALRGLLDTLRGRLDGALALISGRAVAELDRLFGHPGWSMAGLHGLELVHPGGDRTTLTVDPVDRARMRAAANALAAGIAGARLEDKGTAMAVHVRGVPEQMPMLLRAARQRIDALPGYALQPGDMVVEFKPAGVDKGRALQALLAQPPFRGRTPVYAGDDLTDEDGFAAANLEGGLSIRVGGREPTLARYTLPDPSAVRAWLQRLSDTLEGPTTHAPSDGA